MPEMHNIYCDESCHLENDGQPAMVLGAIWCPLREARTISKRIREIRIKHKVPDAVEIKWTQIRTPFLPFYRDLVDYFFDDDDLHFRCIIIPDKSKLNHQEHNQSHDQWYYKMCFRMIEQIIDPKNSYRIYLDIRDTKSECHRMQLEKVLRNSRYDHTKTIIHSVQQIRSNESTIMQLADLLIGAISYRNRRLHGSSAKESIINRIQSRSKKRLDCSTWLRETKFNIFRWEAW